MGWSKYDEDNRELREERVALRNTPTVFTLQNLISASIEAYPQRQAVTAEVVSPVNCSRLPKAFKKKRLVCKDCGAKFNFTPLQQERFQTLGFEAPKRCKACRQARKAAYAFRFTGTGSAPDYISKQTVMDGRV